MGPTLQTVQDIQPLAIVGEQSDTIGGLAISDAVAQNASNEWMRDVARLSGARSSFALGRFGQAERICEALREQETEQTGFRGRILRLLAMVVMTQEPDSTRLGEVEGWLDEAQTIFENERDPYQLGQVFQAQGQLLCWKGDIAEGAALIKGGQRLEASYRKRTTVFEAAHPAPAWQTS